ncbi:MAG: hypothetical protein GX153_05910 [Clostridiaceae bacterium]|nr:hypothetical protein [Clostridiaceae bacterium]
MPAYAVLIHPGHESISYEHADRLVLQELESMAAAMTEVPAEMTRTEIAGCPALSFLTGHPLTAFDIRQLYRMSFVYAVFECRSCEGRDVLLPIDAPDIGLFDDSLVTMLKYAGKTNPIFTRLLVNLAVQASAFAGRARLQMLDPVAGKGTTLFEGLVAGHDVCGIEISPEAVQDGIVHMKKYLETGKFKHRVERQRISGPNRSFRAERTVFEISKSKEDAKKGLSASCEMVCGEARHADGIFRKERFHVIVGDLPYGVRHGNITSRTTGSPTRNPGELVAGCLPAWVRCLRPGGTVALSWNAFVLPRVEMDRLFQEAGLIVLDGTPYGRLEHRVDQAIKRDVIVARKPGDAVLPMEKNL